MRSERLTVVPRSLELERHLERQLLLGDGFNIDVPDSTWLRSDSSELDAVDEGLLERNVFDARVVEAVHVVPVWNQRPCLPT